MAEVQRISVREARLKATSNQALLVCAYDDEGKYRKVRVRHVGETGLRPVLGVPGGLVELGGQLH